MANILHQADIGVELIDYDLVDCGKFVFDNSWNGNIWPVFYAGGGGLDAAKLGSASPRFP